MMMDWIHQNPINSWGDWKGPRAAPTMSYSKITLLQHNSKTKQTCLLKKRNIS